MKFTDFGFKQPLNDALNKIGFEKPTKIQEKVIPHLRKMKNIVAQSHTGTGKTHAFLLPILDNLDVTLKNRVQCLIITPTRELARQIYKNIKDLTEDMADVTSAMFIGGDDINRQVENLQNTQPMIVVGTPTRLKDLYNYNALRITTTKYVVIDECDMIFDLGFIQEVDLMLSKMNKDVNISLFSATINNALKPFFKKYLNNAVFVEDLNSKPTNKNIEHILIWTRNKENKDILKIIQESINPYLAIIFVNRKDQVRQIIEWLNDFGIKNVGELHGDLDSRQRANMQKRIQNHEFLWIVASDVASRGIDIDGVSHIISVDLPKDLDYYIHRSGRTGRNTYTGYSYVLHNSDNQHQIDELKHQGLTFSNKKYQNDELVDIVVKEKVKQPIRQTKADIETQKVISKYKKQAVKPGYKKKRKAEVENIKKQIRRQHIKESIAKIKKEKYAKRRQEIFDED